MNIIRIHILFSTILLFVATSCSNEKKYEKQITVLDSLNSEIEKKLAIFLQIDTIKLDSILTEQQNNLDNVSSLVRDTLQKNEMEILLTYNENMKALQFIKKNSGALIRDAQLNQLQLKNLVNDLKKDVFVEASAFEYYSQEKSEAQKFLTALTENATLYQTEKDRFISLSEKVKSFIESQKNKLEKK